MEERERLQLRGLLPPRAVTMEIQVGRLVDDLIYGRDYVEPEEVRVSHQTVNSPLCISRGSCPEPQSTGKLCRHVIPLQSK